MNKGEEPEETLDQVPSSLKLLAEKTTEMLNDEQSRKITNVLLRYQDVLSKSESNIGRASGVPVKQNPRRLPLGKRQEQIAL